MRKNKGFTLVELLVVIGIIALLISILLPALSSARRNANTVKCLSNLRQIATAMQLYAADFRGAIPVVRQDYPDPDVNPAASSRYYWWDMITPYLARINKSTVDQSTQDLTEARQTVIWGCTEWDARMDVSFTTGSFYPGYGMNVNPYYTPTFSTFDRSQAICRWGPPPVSSSVYLGKYYKLGSITTSAERMLVADAFLWIIDARVSTGSGVASLPGQPVDWVNGYAGKTGQPGQMDYDLYRHAGKPPAASGGFYSKTGKVACNAVFFDGHASTINGIEEAYKAIFIKAP
jgi:prepilin-type N-terminal cleavage/methylation domain-containing protein/prepilin-type processing-associated H-X9-DG protein